MGVATKGDREAGDEVETVQLPREAERPLGRRACCVCVQLLQIVLDSRPQLQTRAPKAGTGTEGLWTRGTVKPPNQTHALRTGGNCHGKVYTPYEYMMGRDPSIVKRANRVNTTMRARPQTFRWLFFPPPAPSHATAPHRIRKLGLT